MGSPRALILSYPQKIQMYMQFDLIYEEMTPITNSVEAVDHSTLSAINKVSMSKDYNDCRNLASPLLAFECAIAS